MIPITTFAGRRVAVFGLGRSGLATVRALRAGGAEVFAGDDHAVADGDLYAADWSRFEALVLSPGIPLTHPQPHKIVALARAAHVEIVGDMELFARERAAHAPDAPLIAVTGTNGKSTTTALIAHLLREAGLDVQMGGNIGIPVLELAPPANNRVHVLECSSFQIDLTPSLHPSVGILLNITPDHLDRHGTLAHYASIKERLVAGARQAIIGIDDEPCRAIAARYPQCLRVSALPSDIADVYVADHKICVRGIDAPVVDLQTALALRGVHNGQNAAFAFAAARALGVLAQESFATFPGLKHRMENVRHIGKVLFVNDSKATNADAARQALSTYQDLYWIAGGIAKAGGIAPLQDLFGRIRKAYFIGQSAGDFSAFCEGIIPYERSETLEQAVASAARDAALSSALEPVVLLSPACASYDQFANFEARGDAFRSLVTALREG